MRGSRRALSLLELLLVATLLALAAAIVVARNGRTLLGNYGAGGDARRVALTLQQARRAAITSGTTHGVVFNSSGGALVSTSVVRVSGGNTVIDGPYVFPPGLTVTTSHAQMDFNFSGATAAAYWVQLNGSNRQWRIDVVPVTGAINVSQIQ
jgi:hypothetical protein